VQDFFGDKGKHRLELLEKVAIVTGGGSGIGKAIAAEFAGQGASVVVASRNKVHLNETVREIQVQGGVAAALPVDLSQSRQIEEMVLKTHERFGRIDILVNNTGIAGPTVAVHDLSAEDWERTLVVNLTGAMLCSRHVIPYMIEQHGGVIIHISARAGIHGFLMRSPYSVSKAGLINFTRTLAMEVGKHNIRVNCISPGPVEGERARKVIAVKSKALNIPVEKIMHDKTSGIALGRFVAAQEVANVAAFLASERSSGITGQNITVDGGMIHQ
jgi:NAD(P)-dependent dehydrogenase (short-subunit alcohol dehydrogenase family)